MDIVNEARIKRFWKNLVSEDFLLSTNTAPWKVSAISSGTTSSSATSKHPGIVSLLSSTTANSGNLTQTSKYTIVLGGGEKSTMIFKTAPAQATVTRRIGFHNTSDVTTPSDGVYCKADAGVLTGQNVASSVISTTPTNYNLAANTWYRLVIEINLNATSVTFTLYADDSDTVLWTDLLTTNIPTALLGHGDVATSSGLSAINIGSLDYMDIYSPNARRV